MDPDSLGAGGGARNEKAIAADSREPSVVVQHEVQAGAKAPRKPYSVSFDDRPNTIVLYENPELVARAGGRRTQQQQQQQQQQLLLLPIALVQAAAVTVRSHCPPAVNVKLQPSVAVNFRHVLASQQQQEQKQEQKQQQKQQQEQQQEQKQQPCEYESQSSTIDGRRAFGVAMGDRFRFRLRAQGRWEEFETRLPPPGMAADIDASKRLSHRRRRSPTRSPAPFDDGNGKIFLTVAYIISRRMLEILGSTTRDFIMNTTNKVNGYLSGLNVQIVLWNITEWQRDEIEINNSNAFPSLSRLRHHKFMERTAQLTMLLGELVVDNGFTYLSNVSLFPATRLIKNAGTLLVASYRAKWYYVSNVMATMIALAFGLRPHHSDACSCAAEFCFLQPKFDMRKDASIGWMNCTVAKWRRMVENSMQAKLMAPVPKSSYTLRKGISVCGNEIVEPGEQCDCGLTEHCNNPCCDPATCRLQPGAECAHGRCCDRRRCVVRPASHVCRPAVDPCDLEDSCDGRATECLTDAKVPDNTTCGAEANETTLCFNGECGSRETRCRQLFNNHGAAASARECYQQNTDTGFCTLRYSTRNGKFEPVTERCSEENKECGQIFCRVDNNHCRRMGEASRDPSMHFVPNGAPCGRGGHCYNATCVGQWAETTTTTTTATTPTTTATTPTTTATTPTTTATTPTTTATTPTTTATTPTTTATTPTTTATTPTTTATTSTTTPTTTISTTTATTTTTTTTTSRPATTPTTTTTAITIPSTSTPTRTPTTAAETSDANLTAAASAAAEQPNSGTTDSVKEAKEMPAGYKKVASPQVAMNKLLLATAAAAAIVFG